MDCDTGHPAPRVARIMREAHRLAGDAAQTELHRAQIETASEPATDLDDLESALRELRIKMARAAAAHGARLVASGTYPDALGREGRLITPGKGRYAQLARLSGLLGEEQMICGCHVHVSVPDDDAAVAVLNRSRRWLPLLAALTANSPFWDGRDTGFDSFRTPIWWRWPTAGPPGGFRDAEDYWSVLDRIVTTGVIADRGMAYWDIRPSDRFPTVEVRVSDVALSTEEAIMLAGLARALVVHCLEGEEEDPVLRPELLRAASWKAARWGLGQELVDPVDGSAVPAKVAVEGLLDRLGPALERFGDEARIRQSVARVMEEGNGATRQRRAFQSGGLAAVVDLAAVEAVPA